MDLYGICLIRKLMINVMEDNYDLNCKRKVDKFVFIFPLI